MYYKINRNFRDMNIITFFSFIFLLLYGSFSMAALSGLESVPPGFIMEVESDVPGAWAVLTSQRGTWKVDTNKQRLYFASPDIGPVTVVCASVGKDNEPVLDLFLFTVRENQPDPQPEPDPGPSPIPDPETLEGVIQMKIKNIVSPTVLQEKKALSDAFTDVINGINSGSVRTSSGARAMFRINWSARAAKINQHVINRWEPAITAISEKIPDTDLETMKTYFTRVVRALE